MTARRGRPATVSPRPRSAPGAARRRLRRLCDRPLDPPRFCSVLRTAPDRGGHARAATGPAAATTARSPGAEPDQRLTAAFCLTPVRSRCHPVPSLGDTSASSRGERTTLSGWRHCWSPCSRWPSAPPSAPRSSPFSCWCSPGPPSPWPGLGRSPPGPHSPSGPFPSWASPSSDHLRPAEHGHHSLPPSGVIVCRGRRLDGRHSAGSDALLRRPTPAGQQQGTAPRSSPGGRPPPTGSSGPVPSAWRSTSPRWSLFLPALHEITRSSVALVGQGHRLRHPLRLTLLPVLIPVGLVTVSGRPRGPDARRLPRLRLEALPPDRIVIELVFAGYLVWRGLAELALRAPVSHRDRSAGGDLPAPGLGDLPARGAERVSLGVAPGHPDLAAQRLDRVPLTIPSTTDGPAEM